MGELLKETEKNKGGNPRLTGSKSEPVPKPKLNDFGISKTVSHRCQTIAV
jgi:hypothetical protein